MYGSCIGIKFLISGKMKVLLKFLYSGKISIMSAIVSKRNFFGPYVKLFSKLILLLLAKLSFDYLFCLFFLTNYDIKRYL